VPSDCQWSRVGPTRSTPSAGTAAGLMRQLGDHIVWESPFMVRDSTGHASPIDDLRN
jgi:hypothetical protein